MIEIIGIAVLVFLIVGGFVAGLMWLVCEEGEREPAAAAPQRKTPDPIRRGYVAFDEENGVTYVMDDKDIEKARLIIRFDGRGVWKTEDGQGGPWILQAEVKDGY